MRAAACLLMFVLACGSKRDPPPSASSGSAPPASAKRARCEQAVGRAAAAIDVCMTWPDDVVACYAEPARLESEACTRALERWQGLASSTPATAGPAPRWQLALPFDALHAVRAAPNVVVLGSVAGVVAIAGGKLAWTSKAHADAALLELAADRCVLAAGDKDVACLGVTSGRVQWRAALPPRTDGEDVVIASAAARDNAVVLATSAGAMYTPSPAACKRKPSTCLTASGEVPGADEIRLLPSGERVLSSVSRVFITDARGRIRSTFTAGLVAGIGLEPKGGVLVAADNKLLHVDTAACAAAGPDPVPIDAAACTTTLAAFDDNPDVPITVDGAVIVPVGTQLHRIGAWKIELGRMCAPIALDGTIYVIAQDGIAGQVELRAIDPATGKTRWASPLPESTELVRPHIVALDDELVVIVGVRAYGFPLTRSP